MTDERLLAQVNDLRRLPAETPWAEFKEDNADPRMIGELISGIANSARLADRDVGYVAWGVRDRDHAVTGTSFEPSVATRGKGPSPAQVPRSSCSETAWKSPIPERRSWKPSASSTRGVAPRSRNEALAALMRRMGLCEEQGTGIDKVVGAAEEARLPPPEFRAEVEATRVTLFGPRRFAEMTIEERLRACYQHAVLRHLSGQRMRNQTLRKRLGIERHNTAQVSKVIRQALDEQLVRPARPGSSPVWLRAILGVRSGEHLIGICLWPRNASPHSTNMHIHQNLMGHLNI